MDPAHDRDNSNQTTRSEAEEDRFDDDHAAADGAHLKQEDAATEPGDACGSDHDGTMTAVAEPGDACASEHDGSCTLDAGARGEDNASPDGGIAKSEVADEPEDACDRGLDDSTTNAGARDKDYASPDGGIAEAEAVDEPEDACDRGLDDLISSAGARSENYASPDGGIAESEVADKPEDACDRGLDDSISKAGAGGESANDTDGGINEYEGSRTKRGASSVSGVAAEHVFSAGPAAAAPTMPAAAPKGVSARRPSRYGFGISSPRRGIYRGRLRLHGMQLHTPTCRTVHEAAFMRNLAATVFFPDDEAKLTVVEGGLHFPPEREAAMRETMAKKISQFRQKIKAAKRGVERHRDADSDTGNSSAGDDVASEPPAPAAVTAKHTDTARVHQRFALPFTTGLKGTMRTEDNKYIGRLWSATSTGCYT
eukprot:TRINITY_DN811_c0_g1_i1.p1 TRINITY_DN811_c0_g1~~TRINITY_DN811_c0_g1_i1.p1  ORF type:complete len:426 (+),score=79.51 TRINITY_DN811_c0_g1_i1:197-1474(+)